MNDHMEALVLGPAEGMDWSRAGGAVTHRTVHVKVDGTRTDGRFSFLESTLHPGDTGPPVHRHPESDEVFFLLEGELLMLLGERRLVAGPGTFILVPKGLPHAFALHGSAPARTVGIFSPAGFEQFHADIASLYAAGKIPGPADIFHIASQYDWEYVGPPLK